MTDAEIMVYNAGHRVGREVAALERHGMDLAPALTNLLTAEMVECWNRLGAERFNQWFQVGAHDGHAGAKL